MSWTSNGGYLFIIVLILGLSKLYVIPAPLTPKTFYEAVALKCPSSIKFPKFSDQDIFTKCKDWDVISNTTSLTPESEDNVLCLLYYDSIVSVCLEFKTEVSIPEIDFTPTQKGNENVQVICNNLMNARSTKKFEHSIIQTIPNNISCVKICSDLSGQPIEQCWLADYFINYDISQITKHLDILNTEAKLKLVQSQEGRGHEVTVKNKTLSKGDVPAPVPASEIKDLSSKNSVTETKVENDDNNPQTSQNVVTNKNAGTQNEVHSGKLDSSDVEQNIPPNSKDQNAPEQEQQKPPPIANDGTNKNDNPPADGTSEKEIPAVGNEGTGIQKEISVADNAGDAQGINPPVENDGNDPNVPLSNEGENTNAKIEDDPNKGLDGVNMEENFPEDDDDDIDIEDIKPEKNNEKAVEPPANNNTIEELDGESSFFSYFMVVCVLFILGYVGYHNRQKIIALLLEGKKGKRQYRNRRPNSSNYHKLDSNLEEAISSSCKKNTNNIIY